MTRDLTDEQIREIFLANGFTIKDGLTDLKPYVYAAARALLAAASQAAEAVPVAWMYQRLPNPDSEKPMVMLSQQQPDSRAFNVVPLYATPPSAQPAAVEQPRWRPIETAPHDGTRVLIYMPEASRRLVQEAYWATPWDGAPNEQRWWSTPHGPAGRGYTILPKAVTHWMPLPSPPTQIAAAPPAEQRDAASLRAAFERYLRSIWTPGYGCPKNWDGTYLNPDAQGLWETFQAGAAAMSPQEGEHGR